MAQPVLLLIAIVLLIVVIYWYTKQQQQTTSVDTGMYNFAVKKPHQVKQSSEIDVPLPYPKLSESKHTPEPELASIQADETPQSSYASSYASNDNIVYQEHSEPRYQGHRSIANTNFQKFVARKNNKYHYDLPTPKNTRNYNDIPNPRYY